MRKCILILSLVLLPATVFSDALIKRGGTSFKVRQGPAELASFSSHDACKAEAHRRTTSPLAAPVETYQAKTGGGAVLETLSSQLECAGPDAPASPGGKVVERLRASSATSGSNVNSCVVVTKYSNGFQPPLCVATFNFLANYYPGSAPQPEPCPQCPPAPVPTCPAAPATRQISRACPSGTTGTAWTQTISVSVGVAPSCTLAIVIGPASAPAEQCAPPQPNSQATLHWTAPTEFTDGKPVTDLAGYRIVYGPTAHELVYTIQVANPAITSYAINGFPPGRHFFAVRAYTSSGTESDSSNVLSKVVP